MSFRACQARLYDERIFGLSIHSVDPSLPRLSCLRSLLLRCCLLTRNVAVDVRGIMCLGSSALEPFPTAPHRRWEILSLSEGVTTGTHLLERTLHEGALRDAGPQEDSVDNQQDPGTFGEDDGGEEQTEPESNFQGSHEAHAEVVIFLNKTTDAVAQSGCLWLLASWCWRWWLQSWEEDAAGVGSDVEDAVDGEWEESKRILAREEPDEGHHY
jgi:hypothetical protein